MALARKSHLDPLAVSLLLVCCMFWGFQQVLVKATVGEVAPVFQAFVRFAIASVAVAGWCLWRGVRLAATAEPAGAARAGLLAGADIAAQLGGEEPVDAVLLPSVAVRDDVFMDDWTVAQLSEALRSPIEIVPPDAAHLAEAALGPDW